MSTLAKYKQIFSSVFSLKDDYDFDKLNYQDIPEWDSIGHMTLVSELENEFSISIETDDIFDFSSFKKGIELLKNIRSILINLILKIKSFNKKIIFHQENQY